MPLPSKPLVATMVNASREWNPSSLEWLRHKSMSCPSFEKAVDVDHAVGLRYFESLPVVSVTLTLVSAGFPGDYRRYRHNLWLKNNSKINSNRGFIVGRKQLTTIIIP
mmetsp:Transcript_17753/g.44290  ORF Transcript_17753/g.44290 Transcript_17753/m.44290 type:complete len:108 (+) Transcript_17753:380-703(+)